MPFVYDKLFKVLEAQSTSMYRLKKDKVIGGATVDKLQAGRGNIDTRTLERLCGLLHVQPGDIMEYIEPTATGEADSGSRRMKGRTEKSAEVD